jgi:hypothetical protein
LEATLLALAVWQRDVGASRDVISIATLPANC